MYLSEKGRLTKHLDFILIDIFSMEVSFIIAYYIRHADFSLFNNTFYRAILIFLVIANITSCYIFNSMQDVIKRSKQLEFYASIKQVVLTAIILVFYLFLTKTSEEISRNVIIIFPIIYLILSYSLRLVYKWLLKKFIKIKSKRQFVIISTKNEIDKILKNIFINITDISVVAVTFIDEIDDENNDGKYKYTISDTNSYDINIVKKSEIIKFLQKEYVDEVFVSINASKEITLLQKISLMGIIIHIELDNADILSYSNNKLIVDKVADKYVLTSTINTISILQLIVKRSMDIILGIIGTIITIILTIFIGPIIKYKSKGPIFFVQDRVGRNGKIFKMYKFRSMTLDADKVKTSLKSQNENKDDLMFKMENDPRVIKGIGEFIRKTSIDEFPQFINVLKGEMSVVGTRPPTVDELEKYDLHHRARLAIKPGITGLWQVSGRSNIKSFDDVVKLDMTYIRNFSLWQDISIIYKTFKVVINKEGAK